MLQAKDSDQSTLLHVEEQLKQLQETVAEERQGRKMLEEKLQLLAEQMKAQEQDYKEQKYLMESKNQSLKSELQQNNVRLDLERIRHASTKKDLTREREFRANLQQEHQQIVKQFELCVLQERENFQQQLLQQENANQQSQQEKADLQLDIENLRQQSQQEKADLQLDIENLRQQLQQERAINHQQQYNMYRQQAEQMQRVAEENYIDRENLRQQLQQERANHQQQYNMCRQQTEQIQRVAEENYIERENLRRQLQQERANHQQQCNMYRQQIEQIQRVAEENYTRQQQPEQRSWIIQRNEVTTGNNVLGEGSWGNVCKGTFLGTPVAVKQLHNVILSPHNRGQFEREMEIASCCRHPNLLLFIGATAEDGNPLFVTELLDCNLRHLLDERQLNLQEIVSLALDVARGLNYLHHKRPPIVHRDIKSDNVLLKRQGTDLWIAKVSDFGAANYVRGVMTPNQGTPIYAAPESGTEQYSQQVRNCFSLKGHF